MSDRAVIRLAASGDAARSDAAEVALRLRLEALRLASSWPRIDKAPAAVRAQVEALRQRAARLG